MTVLSYHSTLFSNVAPGSEAAGTTSSQILLSRSVAGADTNPPSPRPTTPPFVASIYESESAHIMMVGNASTRILPSDFGGESSTFDAGNAAETAVSRLKAEEVACLSSPTPIPAKIRGALAVQLYQASVEDEIPASAKGKGKEIERGRPLERRPRYPNPLARAESWSRRNDAAIEVDVGPIEKRGLSRSGTFFEDPSDPCGALDDHILEPCPSTSICSSVSEVLDPVVYEAAPRVGTFRSSTWSLSQVSPKEQIPRPLTAASNDCHPLFPEPALPVDQASLARPDFSQLEDMATQTSHAAATVPLVWPRLLSKLPERPPGVASTLPTEILQQIYHHLSPTDFNSARRTCRPWYLNSLHGTLLKTMLRRGGFSSRIPTGSPGKPIRGLPPPLIDEWQMSKEIARESALGPDWTGNGLRKQSQTETGESDRAPSPFMQTSKVDFTEVATHYPSPHSAGIIFTVSSCGRFLMAANGCMVFIFALNHNSFGPSPGSLRPITSMICPRRVLATSMDTSSHRYAIAVLMDGRMGLVCDISNINLSLYADSPGSNGSRSSSGKAAEKKASRVGGAPFLDRISLNSSSPATRAGATKSEPPFVFPGIATTGASVAGFDQTGWPNPPFSQADVPVHMRTAGPSSHHDFLPRANIVNPDEQFPNFGDPVDEVQEWCPATMPVETGPRSLYRNLCSEDDPPRSVAICPQRRCVAFGCSSGIELHWVDALTGQDLNRWFPLTAPSDFLYFLPPRKSIDSAKKLRLISSASRPGERPAITDRSFGPHHRNSPFWENFTSEERHDNSDLDSRGILARLRGDARRAVVPGRMDSSDHYKALPLSDGYHILFMDPATGSLCLGSDAPVGGPTKLLRKIWFKGQTGLGSPVSYAGGSDLSFGVRVVAAYGIGAQQSIWLYSVPNDIFVANQSDYFVYPMSYLSTSSVPPDSKRIEWVKWWPDDGLQEWLNHSEDPIPGVLPRSVWPVKIRGQMIGTCNGLVDLAIDSGPDMIIWAFSKDGTATVWKLGDGTDSAIRKIYVMRDGTVRDGDSEGDVEMVDAPAPSPDILEPPLPLVPDTFDGAASFTSASTATYWKPTEVRQHLILREDSLVQYDADGDVIMCEIDDSRRRREERQSWEELFFEHFGGEAWYQSKHWLRQSYKGPNERFGGGAVWCSED